VNPLVTIVTLLVGEEPLGILGVVLATPAGGDDPDHPARLVGRAPARHNADYAKRVMTAHPSPPETGGYLKATHTSLMITDSQIGHDARAALERDPPGKRPALIPISVHEIGTVVLDGSVGSLPHHRAATHNARQVEVR
jgi:hypothetical protein